MNKILSKNEQVKNYLLTSIRSGKFKGDGCLPSENVLSKEMGLSRNTIREAISSLVSGGYLVRIQGKGTFVKNIEGHPSQSNKNAFSITIIGYDVHAQKAGDPFYADILKGFSQVFGDNHYVTSFIFMKREEPFSFSRYVGEHGIQDCMKNGVVFTMYSPTEEDISILNDRKIPFVSIGRYLEHPDKVSFVEADHVAGLYNSTKYLFELGHRKIAFITNPSHKPSYQDRIKGWKNAHFDMGFETDANPVIEIPFYTQKEIEPHIQEFLNGIKNFSAVIVQGDHATYSLMKNLQFRGISVPKDLSVLMYGGYPWVSELLSIDITRMALDASVLGAAAAEMLIKQNKNPFGVYRKFFIPEFSEGSTCRRV